MLDANGLTGFLKAETVEMLIMCGAGDIDALVAPAKELLQIK